MALVEANLQGLHLELYHHHNLWWQILKLE